MYRLYAALQSRSEGPEGRGEEGQGEDERVEEGQGEDERVEEEVECQRKSDERKERRSCTRGKYTRGVAGEETKRLDKRLEKEIETRSDQ
jgi:hypothetical protein